MALRRLQGVVAGRSGENGVAVLMRYTLRLLTLQQFQRATALICACEVDPPQGLSTGDDRWGRTPFRIGLWVGRQHDAQPTDDAAEAIKQDARRQAQFGAVGGSRLAAPTDELPVVRHRRSSPASTSRRDATPRAGPHADLLRRQVRPVPVQQAASRRTRACRSWWWTRRSTAGCRRC